MAIETIHLEHVPATHTVYAAFFRDVTNADFLQSQLLARNSDFEYAFIDASSIISRSHVLAATYKALTVLLDGTLKTPNVHSEIVCSLSASNNIAEAYRRYGITPTTRNLIAIKVCSSSSSSSPAPGDASTVAAHLSTHVAGRPVPLSDAEIRPCTDWARVRKYYRLNGAPALEGRPGGGNDNDEDDDRRVREAEALVLGAMALRGL
ncbi:CGI-121-domain-containing protein [Phialemonium atrogriseum]|uniref:EKC/KEOPS complex subunit CGI121 n=1 Tax=Phialemonium atrogriseum TaxID=1093897 RepID=A0AAJ0FC28_9PEZI|nr:CGI-121-domain-containing protein [Phialemonium atrogriseum]KAK1763151.1 CGI-121-domain-containing protein [Phialemonium atrogriseum]